MWSIRRRVRLLCFVFVLCTFYYASNFNADKSKAPIMRKPKLRHTIVHIDLKGLPPRIEYLTNIIQLLKSSGATGFLMEYEDMFPYTGLLKNVSAPNHYSQDELSAFILAAKNAGMIVIPLIQTFGHMEYVLKHDEFSDLREVRTDHRTICPSKERSFVVIKEMINQVIAFHENITGKLKYIHIGCDEVAFMNVCKSCLSRNMIDSAVFLSHVTRIVNYIQDARVLIWDDMMRAMVAKESRSIAELSSTKVQLAVWQYDIQTLPNYVWHTYVTSFQNMWIASAYKGADGNTSVLPYIHKRIRNTLFWLRFIRNFKKAGTNEYYSFEGIILTGWSRYYHAAPVCDPLPSSIPSLIFNLNLVKYYLISLDQCQHCKMSTGQIIKDATKKTLNLLGCEKTVIDELNLPLNENQDIEMSLDQIIQDNLENFKNCHFRGNDLYSLLKLTLEMKSKVFLQKCGTNSFEGHFMKILSFYFDDQNSKNYVCQLQKSNAISKHD